MKNRKLKAKVENITIGYINLFPSEYKAVTKQLAAEREKNKNRFASVSHNRTILRKISEIPETLSTMIASKMTTEELLLMKDGESGKDYAKWFAERFPEFASANN